MSSYSNYYNKGSLCGKPGPMGPAGVNGLGNITVGSYHENIIDLSFQNITNILFDGSSGFIIDLCDNIISDSSTVLISLGTSFNSFKTWEFDGIINPNLVAQGEDSVKFKNGKNITIESSNVVNPKLTITAIPELTSGVLYPGLDREIMTGWIENNSNSLPLSSITVGFFHDLGYNIDYTNADFFNIMYDNGMDYGGDPPIKDPER